MEIRFKSESDDIAKERQECKGMTAKKAMILQRSDTALPFNMPCKNSQTHVIYQQHPDRFCSLGL